MTEGLILGHYISATGIQVDPAEIQILFLIPTPTTQTEVHSFLGFSGYYNRFIEHYSRIAAPLYALTSNVDFLWTKKCERAFKDLKKLVSIAPVLQGPNWDFPFQISSDASDTVIGAVLGQEEDRKPYAIYYISKNLSPAELNYTVIEKEFLAEFDITIKDRLGKENPVADFLSRMSKPIDAVVVEDQFLDEHLFVVAVQTPGVDMHIRRCVREDEIFDILKSCHDRPCGGHFVDRRTGHKVLQIGYYWPTIFKDAKKFAQAYDSFQRAGGPSQSDEMPLKPQLVIEPFERWALDFVGPINPSSNQKTYIFVATKYVTKWVEVDTLPRATEDSVIQFVVHLFVHYGLPRKIITNGGPQFVGNIIAATLNNYHVQHKITTPYHPQANG
eukprot:PITA_06866